MHHSAQDSHLLSTEASEIISLSLPLIGAWLIYSMTGFIGTAMIARLGQDALGASVIIGSIWTVLNVFSFGMFSSVSVLVSHQYGARNYKQVGGIVRHAIQFGLLLCIPIIIFLWIFPYFLPWITKNPAIIKLATLYAHSIVWSVPSVIILVILEHFLNGIGKTKISLWISILEVPFEIALIYIFIFGKLGMPALGIAGAGYGFAASYGITVIVLLLYLLCAKFVKPFELFRFKNQLYCNYVKELIHLGLPIGLMYLIEVTALTAATLIMARFDTVTLAAQQIAIQFLSVTINIPYAVGQAVSIRIGHRFGQKDKLGIQLAGMLGMLFSFICALIISALYFLFPDELLRIDIDINDINNQALVNQASMFLMIIALFQLLDSFRVSAASVLRALKDTKFSMYISLLSFWGIGLGLGYFMGVYWHFGGVGIWLGITLGVALGAVVLFTRMQNKLHNIQFKLSS